MFRTAETEKYAHVTYFFNCGIETPFPGEERELIPSPHVATYDMKPEMSAAGITDALCRAILSGRYDFILVNFANGDMVGHTGVLQAAVKAVETVDRCLERVLKTAAEVNATMLITADHGNCEVMIDPETGGPHTAHTTNPVPFVHVDHVSCRLRAGCGLRDVGPTVLTLLDLDIPAEMSGMDLREVVAT
jgi:2,3-bisphosphoglycerate-independent phosphoglycerate mutase